MYVLKVWKFCPGTVSGWLHSWTRQMHIEVQQYWHGESDRLFVQSSGEIKIENIFLILTFWRDMYTYRGAPPITHWKARFLWYLSLLVKYVLLSKMLLQSAFASPARLASLPALHSLSSGLTCFVWISVAVLQLSWEGLVGVDRSRFFRSIKMTVWVRAVEARQRERQTHS